MLGILGCLLGILSQKLTVQTPNKYSFVTRATGGWTDTQTAGWKKNEHATNMCK